MLFVGAITGPAAALGCQHDAECGCDGSTICAAGACVAAFTLPVFPVGVAGASPYATPVIAALDHAGAFYTGCCDTRITVFTGETAERDASAVLCPVEPTFPACLFASCLCGYAAAISRAARRRRPAARASRRGRRRSAGCCDGA